MEEEEEEEEEVRGAGGAPEGLVGVGCRVAEGRQEEEEEQEVRGGMLTWVHRIAGGG